VFQKGVKLYKLVVFQLNPDLSDNCLLYKISMCIEAGSVKVVWHSISFWRVQFSC